MGELRKHVVFHAHHAEVLARLHRRARLAVCSNFSHTDTARAVLAEAGLLTHFDAVVVSMDVGIRKPRPEIFRAALEALGADPGETLHVGDSLDADVAGAAELGIRPVWLTRRVRDPTRRARGAPRRAPGARDRRPRRARSGARALGRGMSATPSVTIAIPTLNEAANIRPLVERFLATGYPNLVEILVADGGSSDGTREQVGELGARDSRVALVDNPGRIQANGLNLALERARGEIFLRADAHCLYASDYVERCVETLLETGALNVGGAQRFVARTPFQAGIALASRSLLGSGGARYRDPERSGWAETVYLGCFWRDVLREVGAYSLRATNEDYELNIRLLAKAQPGAGGELPHAVYVCSRIRVEYFPRGSWSSLFRQYYWYGRGRCRTILEHPGKSPLRSSLSFWGISAVLGLVALDLTVLGGHLHSVAAVGLGALVVLAEGARTALRFARALPRGVLARRAGRGAESLAARAPVRRGAADSARRSLHRLRERARAARVRPRRRAVKVAVIGGSGFIGTRLVARLHGAHQVKILDKAGSAAFPELVTRVDVCDAAALDRELAGQEAVVHLAAEHRDDVTPTSRYYEVNVAGTQNVLAALARHRIERLVFTSTVAVYGLDRPEPDEDAPLDPFGHYGISKRQAEDLMRAWQAEDPARRLTIVRPSVVFGEANRGNVLHAPAASSQAACS